MIGFGLLLMIGFGLLLGYGVWGMGYGVCVRGTDNSLR